MPRPPRLPAPDHPDAEARLLAAVAERDAALALRLVDRYTHRRGIAALQRFLAVRLTPGQGPEAAAWLADLARLEPAPASPAPAAAAEQPAWPQIQLETVAIEPPAASPAADLDPTWLDDLAREQHLLAAATNPPQPSPPSPPHTLIPRLQARLRRSGSSTCGPAPAPASLARLRSWLHDDDALPEAS